MRSHGDPSRTRINQVFPTYDVSSRHAIHIAASPARVYEVVRHADFGRPRLVRLLMGLRAIPALLASGLGATLPFAKPLTSAALGNFTVISESPGDEFVLGIMGRFWTPTPAVVPAAAERFWSPPPTGVAQAVWNFKVRPSGAGTELSTETRVRCGDAATLREFKRYWRVIGPGSRLIRGSILRSVRSTAELTSTSEGAADANTGSPDHIGIRRSRRRAWRLWHRGE